MPKESVMSTALATTSEPVLASSHGGLFKSKFRMHLGRFELTSNRITYYQKSTLWLMFGALGMILSRYTAGKRALDIDLGRIATLARGKYGFNKKILDITMADGTSHRLTIDRYEEFTNQLREQIARHAHLDATGEERWAVRAQA
jgi:hypothetical protein